jgi:hypothetical protein
MLALQDGRRWRHNKTEQRAAAGSTELKDMCHKGPPNGIANDLADKKERMPPARDA